MNKKQEKEFDKLSKTLNIVLPFGHVPLPIKIVAFLTSAGGLSILANIFSDFLHPSNTLIVFYFLRILAGLAMVIVGYGILKKQEWSIWIYGVLSLVSIFINPVLSIVPVTVTVYLISEHKYFNKGHLSDLRKNIYNKFFK